MTLSVAAPVREKINMIRSLENKIMTLQIYFADTCSDFSHDIISYKTYKHRIKKIEREIDSLKKQIEELR